ncbi:MAG TPA: DUF1318 domain-containing protein [Thermohalobaculum sp.]|nr:DUF1318 domain-containing protein [Thermohalobaculum sp.]
MRWLAGLLVAFAVLVGALVAGSGPASAQERALDSYRASGVIAERFDGYVEIRAPAAPIAPAEARALVEEVNAKRRALYTRRAEESDVAVEQVGKLFATKIVETAPVGTFFLQPGGDYVRK